ncbi:MAG: septal ring lytic transglycosylase RlpA family protein [Candidatus Daviesbacteria bacterium]|nr:septal ring lytic transglycosylase RlpA family protein [Candidatus Daviesbacteria bacterium]
MVERRFRLIVPAALLALLLLSSGGKPSETDAAETGIISEIAPASLVEGYHEVLDSIPELTSNPEPDPTEKNPAILDIPELGKFYPTNLVMEGPASTYSVEGCLGCRPDRLMANGDPLDNSKLTLAALPEFLLNTYVLVENITIDNDNKFPDNRGGVVAKVTDRGRFPKGRIADLTLTTNHFVLGGQPLPQGKTLIVRLTGLEPIESVRDNLIPNNP